MDNLLLPVMTEIDDCCARVLHLVKGTDDVLVIIMLNAMAC